MRGLAEEAICNCQELPTSKQQFWLAETAKKTNLACGHDLVAVYSLCVCINAACMWVWHCESVLGSTICWTLILDSGFWTVCVCGCMLVTVYGYVCVCVCVRASVGVDTCL